MLIRNIKIEIWLLIILLMMIFPFVSVFAASPYYVSNPTACPTDAFSQSCVGGLKVCGVNSSNVISCYDNTALNPPTSSANSSSGSSTASGGYYVDCYGYDSAAPYCNNNGLFVCLQNATCDSLKKVTVCTASQWANSTCGSCKTGYHDCDGNTANGCSGSTEQDGVSCTTALGLPGTYNNCVCVGSILKLGSDSVSGTNVIQSVSYPALFVNGYNVGVGTSTPSSTLQVFGSGDVIDVSLRSIGGLDLTPTEDRQAVPLGYLKANYQLKGTYGNVFGSGTGRYLTKWAGTTATSSITNSLIYDNGTSVGIDTTSPFGKMDIRQGMSSYLSSFASPHLKLSASSTVDNTGFVGIVFDSSTTANYGWSMGSLRSTNGVADFVWKNHQNSVTGTEMFRITSNGRVGIGTNNPGSLLQIGNDATNPTIILESTSTGDEATVQSAGIEFGETTGARGSIWYTGNGYMHIGMNNRSREHMRFSYNATNTYVYGSLYLNGATTYFPASGIWNSSGNLGIGTTSPVAKLGIGVTGRVIHLGNGGTVAGLTTPTARDEAVNLGYLQDNYNPTSTLLWGGSLTGNIFNNNTGNVSIGTSSAAAKFSIYNNNAYSLSSLETSINAANAFRIRGRNTAAATLVISSLANTLDYGIQAVNDAGDAGTNISINPFGGNVGIGTTDPALKLEVKTAATTSIANGFGIFNQLSGTSALGNGAALLLGYNNSQYYNKIATVFEQNNPSYLNPALVFYTMNNTYLAGSEVERMRISSNGNVGIGTSTPGAKLDVYYGTTRLWHSTGAYTQFNANELNHYTSTGGANTLFIQYPGGNWHTNIGRGALFIQGNNGNVGVGTSSFPAYDGVASKLRIYGSSSTGVVVDTPTSSVSDFILASNNSPKWHLLNRSASGDRFELFAGGAGAKLVVLQSGNVGIGTTNPTSTLHVYGEGNVINVSQRFIGGLDLTPTENDQAVPLGYLKSNYNSSSTLFWGGSLTGNISNNNTGNVGVGTTSPAQKLHVAGNLRVDNSIYVYDPTYYSRIYYEDSGGKFVNHIQRWGGQFNWRMQSSGEVTRNLASLVAVPDSSINFFEMYSQTGGASTVRINTNGSSYFNGGNVGIGTTNPGTAKLSVEINSTSTDFNASSYPLKLRNVAWTGNQITGIEFWNGVQKTVPTARIISQMNGSGAGGENLYFQTQPSSAINPNPNQPTTKFSILADGNVGIGTAVPYAKLHVYNAVDGVFNGLVVDNRKTYGAGTGVNETSRILLSLSESSAVDPLNRVMGYIESGVNSESNSTDGWLALGSRTSANATEKLRITSNGNVGIGITNPGAKLQVYGDYMRLQANNATNSPTRFQFGDQAGQNQAFLMHDAGSSWYSGLSLNHYYTGNNVYTYSNTSSTWKGAASILMRHDAAILFRTISDGTSTEPPIRMIVDNSGKVGLGTTTPSMTLSIYSSGSGTRVVNVGNGAVAGLVLTPTNPDEAASKSYVDGLFGNAFMQGGNSFNANATLGTNDNFNLNFETNSTTKMVLNTSGYLGIGTTTPAARLQVKGGLILNHTSVADANYTATVDDYVIGYTSLTANRVVTLPNSLCIPGRYFAILDESGSAGSGSAAITIDPEGSTNIIGSTTLTINGPYNSVYVFCGGNNQWFIL